MFRFAESSSIVLAIALAIAPGLGAARVWRVAPDHSGDAPTIAAAVDSADAGDIVLLAPGTYSWTSEGAQVFTMVHLRPGITLRGENGAAATILDGESQGRLLTGTDVGADCVIEDLTFRNGYAASHGGAIAFGGESNPTLRRCIFIGNHATVAESSGGAVRCDDATFEDCEFIENRAALDQGPASNGHGGAIAGRDLRIERCVFRANRSHGYEAAAAGAVDCRSSVIVDSTFEDNWADCPGGPRGGAIRSAGTSTIERCVFRRNRTDAHYFHSNGGAIELAFGTIRECLFFENAAECWRGPGRGGAVFGLDYAVSDCVFVSNRALRTDPVSEGYGGALYARFDLRADHCTLFSNSAGTSSGVAGVWAEESARMRQVLVVDSFNGRVCNEAVSWECSVFYSNESGDAVCGTDNGLNSSVDPFFCNDPLAAGDVSLRSDSPCLAWPNCDRIGAGGVGCIASAVSERTWTGVKTLFR